MKQEAAICGQTATRGGLWLAAGIMIALLHPSDKANAFADRKAPEITSPAWINSEPLSLEVLQRKVVLVEFWTFGCFNCRNIEPYVKAWHKKYAEEGLVVIGIHSPEFAYERDTKKVEQYIREHEIRYPVAIDNDFATWNRFGNRYWPAIYLIDKRGVIRYTRFGEGGYSQTDQTIQALLTESIPERGKDD